MARELVADARRLLAQGIDPSEKRKADKRAAALGRQINGVRWQCYLIRIWPFHAFIATNSIETENHISTVWAIASNYYRGFATLLNLSFDPPTASGPA
jgi:hypothetical protein